MLIVVLVVVFCRPEGGGFGDFGCHLITFAFKNADKVFSHFFLFVIQDKISQNGTGRRYPGPGGLTWVGSWISKNSLVSSS